MADIKALLEQSDKLYFEKKWREAGHLLSSYHDLDDAEVLWRIVRSLYRTSKYYSKDATEAEETARRGFELSKKALEIDSNNFQCYKWAGIILSHHTELLGQREKIASAVEVKEHFEKAIALNPNDMTVRHLLGRWHYKVASVPWYVRSAARLIYSTPPSSTHQEALTHFEAAEKLNKEDFYDNWLFLAKTYYELSEYEQAKKWATKVTEFKGDAPDLAEAKTECAELLRKF